jgi:ribosome assembly protein 4
VLKGHKQWVTSLAWEPANLAFPTSRLASASKDCTVRIWDTRLKRCLLVLGVHTKAVSHVKWGGSGLLYTCSQVRSALRRLIHTTEILGFLESVLANRP